MGVRTMNGLMVAVGNPLGTGSLAGQEPFQVERQRLGPRHNGRSCSLLDSLETIRFQVPRKGRNELAKTRRRLVWMSRIRRDVLPASKGPVGGEVAIDVKPMRDISQSRHTGRFVGRIEVLRGQDRTCRAGLTVVVRLGSFALSGDAEVGEEEPGLLSRSINKSTA